MAHAQLRSPRIDVETYRNRREENLRRKAIRDNVITNGMRLSKEQLDAYLIKRRAEDDSARPGMLRFGNGLKRP